jgi:cation diffusion facilitator CzcD-associated flavoprotein CzcO
MKFLSIAILFVAFAHTAPTDYPVCIVGAGPAGLAAGNRLQSNRQKTVIFEKQALVGGKCQAVYQECVK